MHNSKCKKTSIKAEITHTGSKLQILEHKLPKRSLLERSSLLNWSRFRSSRRRTCTPRCGTWRPWRWTRLEKCKIGLVDCRDSNFGLLTFQGSIVVDGLNIFGRKSRFPQKLRNWKVRSDAKIWEQCHFVKMQIVYCF